jgi:hypothetical protein
MDKAARWPVGPQELLTHLEALDQVQQTLSGMERDETIVWLVGHLRAGAIYAEWIRDGQRRHLKIDFWMNPKATQLFDTLAVDAARPFGPHQAFSSLREETYIWLARVDLEKCIAAERQSIGGRPLAFDWAAIEAESVRLMEHHGDFTDDDPEWNAQARLETALLTFCQRTWKREPGLSTLREKLILWLVKWRENKMVGN